MLLLASPYGSQNNTLTTRCFPLSPGTFPRHGALCMLWLIFDHDNFVLMASTAWYSILCPELGTLCLTPQLLAKELVYSS
jgi:hypothetical protein